MIKELLNRVLEEVGQQDEVEIVPEPAEPSQDQIPTLQADYYRPMSPQLRERFTSFGAWPEATHADWLSLGQMAELWTDPNATPSGKQRNLVVMTDNWPNDATALFKADRISVFALSEEGNERMYLLWFDCIEEPEVWVYDTNGEAHYRDLKTYLEAYLDDDLTAYNRHWILGNNPD